MIEALNHVDLCFVVDTTGSMGPFIQAAQQHLLDTLRTLGADRRMDLQVGLVEYRDHPPQDHSFVVRAYPLTADLQEMQKVINRLQADGGGDAPEAVYDGVHEACVRMKWRVHGCRFILLVGDAPPHGAGAPVQDTALPRGRRRSGGYGDTWGDTWAEGCPCGLTTQSVTAAAENQRVTVHALCMGDYAGTVAAFTAIAIGTGGQCARAERAEAVVGKMAEVLSAEFRDLQWDEQVLETVRRLGHLDVAAVAGALACPRLQAAAAIARLGKRGFWEGFQGEG